MQFFEAHFHKIFTRVGVFFLKEKTFRFLYPYLRLEVYNTSNSRKKYISILLIEDIEILYVDEGIYVFYIVCENMAINAQYQTNEVL